MSLRVDIFKYTGDDAVRVNDVGNARGQLHKQQVSDGDVIETGDFHIGIDQQVERQLLLLAKPPVRFGIIEADAEDHCVFGFELLVQIAEPASLHRSARRAVFREKIKNHIFTASEV
jgi:hypothetical protein